MDLEIKMENTNSGTTTKDFNSICMACYNGEKYIAKQIDSILKQIAENDELIIVDDCSTDNTVRVINDFEDKRIQLVCNNTNIGVNKAFEKAIKKAKGTIIFMADQDDIWTENRYVIMTEKLKEKNVMCVSGNSIAIDGEGNYIDFYLGELHSSDSYAYKKNIEKMFAGKAYYYGCAMAFHRNLDDIILPFPQKIESHDLWIAMAANLLKSNYHIDDVVLERRVHGSNASIVSRPLSKKIYSRIVFVWMLFQLKKRMRSQQL